MRLLPLREFGANITSLRNLGFLAVLSGNPQAELNSTPIPSWLGTSQYSLNHRAGRAGTLPFRPGQPKLPLAEMPLPAAPSCLALLGIAAGVSALTLLCSPCEHPHAAYIIVPAPIRDSVGTENPCGHVLGAHMKHYIVIIFFTLLLCAQAASAQDWARARLEKSPRHREWVTLKRDGRAVETLVLYPASKTKPPALLIIH